MNPSSQTHQGRTATAHRRRRAGVTLVESLMAVSITALISAGVMQTFIPALRMGKIVTSKATLQRQARRSMDYLVQDIRGSAGVVSRYGNYTSGPSTLILRAPSYNASYQQIQGSFDYTVYRLVGSQAPYKLVRSVTAGNGSARPSWKETVLAERVASLNFDYLAEQTITGDGISRKYPLLSVKLAGAVNNLFASPTGAAKGTVMIYDFTVADAFVIFTSAPSLGAKIRLLYRADPAEASNETYIESVTASLHLTDPDPSIHPVTARPTIELSGGAEFRNRE